MSATAPPRRETVLDLEESGHEAIVCHAEDSGVESDPEREREQSEQSKPGRLEQLPESKTKVGHHSDNTIEMRRSAQLDSNKGRRRRLFLSTNQRR